MTAIPTEIRAEIDKLERKHAENPGGRYFVPLANAYRRAGIVNRAISVLGQGISRHPDYLSAHIVLGRCYTDQGKIEAARGEFSRVLSVDPHNLVALRTLGELAVADGNPRDARNWYEQLLAVDPMNDEARIALGALDLATGPPPTDGHAPTAPAGAPASPVVDLNLEPADDAVAPIAAFSIPVALPLSDDAASAIPPIRFASSDDAPAATAPPAHDTAEYEGEEILITETLAELYTRQGFFDRAIHVYRELIRRHGDDPRLRDRLSRVERLASGGADVAEETLAPETSVETVDEIGAEATVEATADLAAEAPAPEVSVDAPSETTAAAGEPGESVPPAARDAPRTGIQDYLARLLSWHEDHPAVGVGSSSAAPRDAGPPADAAESVLEVGTPPTATAGAPAVESADSRVDLPPLAFPEDAGAGEVAEAGASAEAEVSDESEVESPVVLAAEPAADHVSEAENDDAIAAEFATDTADADPVSGAPESTTGIEETTASDESTPTVEYVAPTWGPAGAAATSDPPEEDLFPWELPQSSESAHAARPEAPAPEPPATSTPDPETSFDFGDEIEFDEPEASADSFASLTSELTEDGPVSESDGEGEDDDDDDIESFQAWLRGLKR